MVYNPAQNEEPLVQIASKGREQVIELFNKPLNNFQMHLELSGH